jgi:PAS domain S-box-containing protein
MQSTRQQDQGSPSLHFLPESSEISALLRAFDWEQTTLGPLPMWPQSLKTAVTIVLNSTVPIVMLWGADGIMIYNDAYAVFAGAKHPQLLGSKVLEGWPEVADFNQYVMTHVLNGETLTYTDQQLTLYRNGAAEEVWMNLNYSPIADESGATAGVFAVVVETTERIRAEQRQREAEAISKVEYQKLNRLFINAPAYVAVMHGPDHVYTLVNPLYQSLIGDREVVGKSMRDAFPEIESLRVNTLLDDVFRSGKPHMGKEVKLELDRLGTGVLEPCYFDFVYQPVRDEQNKVSDIFVHAIEVTEAVLSRAKLAASKQKFDALFDSNVVAIAHVQIDGRILEANNTFLKLFGYTKTDIARGLASKHLTVPEFKTVTDAIYTSLRSSGEAEPVEKRYVRKNGEEFPAIVGAAMLPESKHEFMAFILDVSETQKLKELNEAKDEFVALASHQLRTPATSVKQYLSVVMGEILGPVSSEQKRYLEIANNANNRQLNIIDELLKTAEIDTKGFKLSREQTDIVALLHEVMAQFKPVIELKQQHFSFDPISSAPKLSIDRKEMAISFANLIENASKYSANGTAISIELKEVEDSLIITFSDQGVGIDPSDYEKIFEKFTRIDNELSDTVNGNGLGLYWVRRIIELHKGTIDVTSAPRKGSSFIVKLPL